MIMEGSITQIGPLVPVVLRGNGQDVTGVALIDTGGQFTMIDANVAIKLKLMVKGERMTKTACSTCSMKSVAAALKIGDSNQWFEKVFDSTPLHKANPPMLAILGMDWLKNGVLTMDGPKRRWRFVMP